MSEQRDTDWFVLVRHAAPLVERSRPESSWGLSTAGREAAAALAARVHALGNVPVFSGPELKARQTAAILHPGAQLQLDDDLREHGLEPIEYLPARAFGDAIEAFFERPESVMFGAESAASAAQRLARAIERRCAAPAVLVTHGRIISAYVSTLLGRDGLTIWRGLRMPDALLVHRAEHLVQRIGSEQDWKVFADSGSAQSDVSK